MEKITMNDKHHEITHEEVDTSFKDKNLKAWTKKDHKAYNKRQGKNCQQLRK